jgi:ankyrin repeat protein
MNELVDKYFAYKATKLHDKVYALTGMCSDDLSSAGLEPNYRLEWEQLLERLAKFLLGGHVSVSTQNDEALVVIRAQGWVLGKISKSQRISATGDDHVEVTLTKLLQKSMKASGRSIHWVLPSLAKSLYEGDILCMLQGRSELMVFRPRSDHFTVVLTAANVPRDAYKASESTVSSYLSEASNAREFLLVWDWTRDSQLMRGLDQYNELGQAHHLRSKALKSVFSPSMYSFVRIWRVALVFGDIDQSGRAEEHLHAALRVCERSIIERSQIIKGNQQKKHPHEIIIHAVHQAMATLLTERERGMTNQHLIIFAVEKNHELLVRLLLTTDNADIVSMEIQHMSPLVWAARRGDEVLIRLWLERGNGNIRMIGFHGPTLLEAASSGHCSIVRMLLAQDKANGFAKDQYGRQALALSAIKGFEPIVSFLLQNGADVKATDSHGRTALMYAAQTGHGKVVDFLLEKGADLGSRDVSGKTALIYAASDGHEQVIKRLLENGADAWLGDNDGRTALHYAAIGGHVGIVESLVETGVDVAQPIASNDTALSMAVENDQVGLAMLLIGTGRFNVNYVYPGGNSLLSCAVAKGQATVVKMLLETGKVNLYWEQTFWWPEEEVPPDVHALYYDEKHEVLVDTLLSLAARKGHYTIVKLLLGTGKFQAGPEGWHSVPALRAASINGHNTVVELLRSFGLTGRC